MALAHQFNCKPEGIQIWRDWTKLDTRKDHAQRLQRTREKWTSFSLMHKNPVSFATIMKKVQDNKVINFNDKVSAKASGKGAIKLMHNIQRNKFPHTKGKNLTPMNTIENFYVILDEYKIDIKYDVITKQQEVSFEGVVEKDLNKAQSRLESLCLQNDMSANSAGKYKNVAEKEVNTWREWIESKPWDGRDRFNDLCNTVKVYEEHENLKKSYLRAWLMQMIHLTCLNDGESGKMGRFVLVFQSKQWGGKTSWFKALCPKTHQKYLKEAVILDTTNSMSVLGCIKNVFVELGEIGSTFKKSDSDNLKNFISNTTDVLDRKYQEHHQEHRRRTVFFGSVNDQVFLRDSTGNTRYLALPTITCDYEHTIDMQQLYAQLYEAARLGEDYRLDNDLLIEQQNLNSQFQNISYLEEKFHSTFDTDRALRDNKLTVSGILDIMGINANNSRIQSHMNEMSAILKTLGYEKSTPSSKKWKLPPLRT